MSIFKIGLLGKSPPGKIKDIMNYLTRSKVKNTDLPEVTTADKIPIPPKKQTVEEMEAVNAFIRRERAQKAGGGMLVQPSADGLRPGYKKDIKKRKLPKNIRLTEYGNYRFSSEASGEFFSKTFKKLEDAVKYRDKYLKDLGIEEGQLRKKTTGKYETVKGQKHIRFNGVNYQVAIQRGNEGAKYFSNLKDAIKERDALVKKYPPKSFTDYNIKEKPKQVNADILELYKDPTIKNIFKTGNLTNEAIAKAAKILGVSKGAAIDRLIQLSSALMGDRKDVPGIKPAFIENARNILLTLPGARKKAAELATGVPFEGESIKVPKSQITESGKIPSGIVDIDEARATATGLKRNTSPYSIFAQVIDRNVNRIAKGGFEGAGWDSRAGTLEANVDKAIQEFGAKSKEAIAAKVKYNQAATKFENEVNSKKLRGTKRVRIPRISLDPPSQTIANYNKFNTTYKKIFDENFTNKKYSFVIPKDLKTIPELRNEILDPNSSIYKQMINTLKTGFNEFDEKKLFQKIENMAPNQLKKIMRLIPRIASVNDFETNRFASADNVMTSGVQYVDDIEDKNFIERNPITTGTGATTAAVTASKFTKADPLKQVRRFPKNVLGKTIKTLGTPIAGPLFAGYNVYDKMKSGSSFADAVFDPITGLELSFPALFKENVSKITKSPVAQKILSLGGGKIGTQIIPGIGTAITLGSLTTDAAKAINEEANRIANIEDQDLQQLEYENLVKSIKGFAGGGIAGLSGGIDEGPQRRSMNPDSGGLKGLLKRGIKG